jgi:LacI family transcriptional regulator
MKPTLQQVAVRSGVSLATVSRALSDPARVKPQTRLLVERAAADLGYLVDGAARALASGRSRTVGLIVPTLENAIFAKATHALQTTLAAQRYQLLIASHEYNPSAEYDLARALIERSVEALALVGLEHTPAVMELLARARIPVLALWSAARKAVEPWSAIIGFDNRAAGRLAAHHLIELGHCRIGFISGPRRFNDRAMARLQGVRDALAKAGLKFDDSLVTEQPFGVSGGRAGWHVLNALAMPPTAIVAGNDQLALGALFAAQGAGLRVPEQLSIVGFDNIDWSAEIRPGLTTVHLPVADLGQAAAQAVLAAVEHRAVERLIELPVSLVVRGSTAALAAPRALTMKGRVGRRAPT